MQVSIVRPGETPDARQDLCLVIDVLRATTTAAVLCHRLGELCVVRSPDVLPQLPALPAGYALFSELADITSDLPRHDNSPVSAREVDLAGRTPVLVTTNGTLAVDLAVNLAREVVLAAFANLSAVIDHVRRSGAATVAVMPAGNIPQGQRCIEDDGCADTLVARLRGEPVDVPAVIAACRADARIIRRSAAPGLAADMDVCFAIDAVPVVPRVMPPTADHRWFTVRRA